MLDMNENLELFAQYLEHIKTKKKYEQKTAELVNVFWNLPEAERKAKVESFVAGGAEPAAPEGARPLLEDELWNLLSSRGIDIGKAEDLQFIKHVYHTFEYADDKFQQLNDLKTYKTESNVPPHIQKYNGIQKNLRQQLYKTDRRGNETPLAANEYDGGYYPEHVDYIFRDKAKDNPDACFIDANYIFGGRGDPDKVLNDELAAQPQNASTLLTGLITINQQQNTDKLKKFIGTLEQNPQKFDNIVIPLGLDYANHQGHVITMIIDSDKNVQIIDQVGNHDNSSKPHKEKITAMLKELGFEEAKIKHNTKQLSERNRNDCATFSSYVTDQILNGQPIPNDDTVSTVITHGEIDAQHAADQEGLLFSTARLYLDDPLFCMYYKDLGHDILLIQDAIDNRDSGTIKTFIETYKNYHLSDNVKGYIKDGNPSNAHQGLPAEEWKDEIDRPLQDLFQEYEVPFQEIRNDEHPGWLIYQYEDRQILFTKEPHNGISTYINSDRYEDYLIVARAHAAAGDTKIQLDFENRENAVKMLKAAFSAGLEVVNMPDLESYRDMPEYAEVKKLYYTSEYKKNEKLETEANNNIAKALDSAIPDDEKTDEQKEYSTLNQAYNTALADINGSATPPAGTPDPRTPEQRDYRNLKDNEEAALTRYKELMHGDPEHGILPLLNTGDVNTIYGEVVALQKQLAAEQAKPTPDATEIARLQGEISAKEATSPYSDYRQARDTLSKAQKDVKESTLGKALADSQKKLKEHPFAKDLANAKKQKGVIMSEAIEFYISYGNTGNDTDRQRVEKLLAVASLSMKKNPGESPDDFKQRQQAYIAQKLSDYDNKNNNEKAKVLKESQNKAHTAHKLGNPTQRGTMLGEEIANQYRTKQKQYS